MKRAETERKVWPRAMMVSDLVATDDEWETTDQAIQSVLRSIEPREMFTGLDTDSGLKCAACGSYFPARWCDRVDDVTFCSDCLAQSSPDNFVEAYGDLGGEG